MFGFDGNNQGFEQILRKIASNDEQQKLTHKDIRAYARCLLIALPELNMCAKLKPEVEIMLAVLSAARLPHYDRSFLAKQILKLLEHKTQSGEHISDNF